MSNFECRSRNVEVTIASSETGSKFDIRRATFDIQVAVDDLLLGFLLFQSRLVPRGLSLIGILGGVILIGG